MSNNDLASEDNTATDAVGAANDFSEDNPFVEGINAPASNNAPVDDSNVDDDEDEEEDVVSGNTNDSINASLDELKDADVLKGMVVRLRHENGNHRKRNKELQAEVETLKAKEVRRRDSVKEARERAERAENRAKAYLVKLAAEEYGVEEDLFEFLEGAETDEEIFARAERLGSKAEKKLKSYELPASFDPFAGKRGRPVRPGNQKDPGGDYLRDLLS